MRDGRFLKILIERLFMSGILPVSGANLYRALTLVPALVSRPFIRPGRASTAQAKREYDVILTCNYSPWSRYSGGGQ
ncbi:MAG: hypothetical protein JWP91_3070, partial [Fibrobacteres bacterium]|nr:hypothetical protein [Fibrobacterota bacterium]